MGTMLGRLLFSLPEEPLSTVRGLNAIGKIDF